MDTNSEVRGNEENAVSIERDSIVLGPVEADRFLAALEDPSSFEAGLAALTARPSVIGSATKADPDP